MHSLDYTYGERAEGFIFSHPPEDKKVGKATRARRNTFHEANANVRVPLLLVVEHETR